MRPRGEQRGRAGSAGPRAFAAPLSRVARPESEKAVNSEPRHRALPEPVTAAGSGAEPCALFVRRPSGEGKAGTSAPHHARSDGQRPPLAGSMKPDEAPHLQGPHKQAGGSDCGSGSLPVTGLEPAGNVTAGNPNPLSLWSEGTRHEGARPGVWGSMAQGGPSGLPLASEQPLPQAPVTSSGPLPRMATSFPGSRTISGSRNPARKAT